MLKFTVLLLVLLALLFIVDGVDLNQISSQPNLNERGSTKIRKNVATATTATATTESTRFFVIAVQIDNSFLNIYSKYI